MTLARKLMVVALPLAILAGCATESQVEKANMTAAEATKSAQMAAQSAAKAARAAERAAAEARAAGDKADRIFRKGLRK